MIPPNLHMFWAGGNPLPVIAGLNKSIWKGDVRIWSEKDLPQTPQVLWCIENKQWSALSDFCRHWAVAKYGGWYLDTDMEILKPDWFAKNQDYEFVCGLEKPCYANAAFCGGQKGNKYSVELMEKWEEIINVRSITFQLPEEKRGIPLASLVGPLMQTELFKTRFNIDLSYHHHSHDLGFEINGARFLPEHIAFGIGYQAHMKGVTNVHPDAICRHYWHNSGR